MAFLFVVNVAACASTSMSSMPAPEVQGRMFHNILVIAGIEDLGVMRATEDRFAAASVQGNIRFVPAYGVFFPGRQYSSEQASDMLHQYQIDGVLVVAARQTVSTTYYVPPTYTSGCTSWSPVYGCAQVTTTQSGGGTYAKPSARFSAQLYDPTTGLSVWIATASTGGDAYATNVTLVRSMADKTVARLVDDGIIAFCPPRRDVALAQVHLHADSLDLANARQVAATRNHYVIPYDASPERRKRLEALNDSLATKQRSADSLVTVLSQRQQADEDALQRARRAVSVNCTGIR